MKAAGKRLFEGKDRVGSRNPMWGNFKLKLETILPLYQSGLSIAKIAKRVGCNHCTVERLFKREGVETRKSYPMEIHPNWKGGKRRDKSGYIRVRIRSKKEEYEHRIATGALRGEVVHHRNGIKSDNEDSNLEIYQNNSQHFKANHLNRQRNERGQYL